MKTEQDTRRFMQENRIPVPKDTSFMDELVRQINLLPVPASLENRDARVQENISMLRTVMEVIRKHNRKQALRLVLVNVIVCMTIFITGYFLITPQFLTGDSSAVMFILRWRHVLMSFICLAVLAVSIRQADIIL